MRQKTSPLQQVSLNEVLVATFKKLNPLTLYRNPVIFITEIGAFITLLEKIIIGESAHIYTLEISICLWLTVLFANAAEAIAEFQTKGQANTIKMTRRGIEANKKVEDGSFHKVSNTLLKRDDLCLVKAGDLIPADGQIVEGAAAIDESSFTGESQPVIRQAGTDHDTVIAGTKVISDQIIFRVAADPGQGYLDRLIELIESSQRKKAQSEISLSLLLSSLTLIFLFVVVSFQIFGAYYKLNLSITIQTAFLICLIPTTIAGLLNAIGIAGMSRLMMKNVLALSGKSIEAAGDVNMLIFDKTGTLTTGNRVCYELIPSLGVSEEEFHKACFLSSLCDSTPEGMSIIDYMKRKYVRATHTADATTQFVPFSAYTRLSGVDIGQEKYRKGSVDAVLAFCKQPLPSDLSYCVQRICERGGTPLLVASTKKILGVIFLKDRVKSGLSEKFAAIREMGIRTLLVTGDNPITAKAIAGESNIDETAAGISPEEKLSLMKQLQNEGLVIGMTGDGVNDVLALAQADLAVAMHEGAQAAKEAANMIDLDSNPSKLYEIVQIGKQMVITRGALTTFSITTDISKYFILLPAILMQGFDVLSPMNILHLSSPSNAIMSVVVFNTLILAALIPLSYKGVKLTAQSAKNILNKNLLLYGLGGIIFPLICIKLIDWILNFIQQG